MLPRRTSLALILASALLTAGCGEIITAYADLIIVQRKLQEKFGDEVQVNALAGSNGATFMVWFINSPLNEKSPQDRATRAAEAAKVVKETYKRIQALTDIMVGFLRQDSPFPVYDQKHIVAMHGFDKNGVPLPGRNDDRDRPADALQVNTNYDSHANQSDISVNGMQLEGKPGGLGLTILPFFVLQGDARNGKKLPPPKAVELNFASYAEKPTFKQTVPLTFVVDGKVALKIDGDFTGNDAQFCYLKIPYEDFKRIVSGKELTIKLGDKVYPLTPSQLGAMQHMTDYVRE
jgi:hypothetical protein